MRVGVTGPLHPDSLADNVLDCLRDLGVTPVALGPIGPERGPRLAARAVNELRRFGAEAEQLAQRSLAARVVREDCDVVINVYQSLAPGTVRRMRARARRVCLWYPDHLANVGRLSLAVAGYDALFLKDQVFTDRLRDVYGLPAFYVPEACNPRWHRPAVAAGTEVHIAVVGNIYPTRAVLLNRLHADGVPLRLYGNGFPRWLDVTQLGDLHTGRFVMREDKARVFRQARGVLNNLHPAELDSVNCRLFEATASGGAVLCEYRDALGELFEVGTEVLAFRSYDELLEQCRGLLADEQLTVRIGDAASARALREHTYQQRLERMLDVLG